MKVPLSTPCLQHHNTAGLSTSTSASGSWDFSHFLRSLVCLEKDACLVPPCIPKQCVEWEQGPTSPSILPRMEVFRLILRWKRGNLRSFTRRAFCFLGESGMRLPAVCYERKVGLRPPGDSDGLYQLWVYLEVTLRTGQQQSGP